MEKILRLYKALSDPARLRIIRVLDHESLNVGELTQVLGLAQSSVSQKLGELRRSGIVREKREGGFTYYTLEASEETPIVESARKQLAVLPDAEGDLARLVEVRKARRERGMGKGVEPGRSWVAWAKALRFVLPPLRVADLGCGDGALTAEIALWAKEVLAVEKNPSKLERARKRFSKLKLNNIQVIQNRIETLEPEIPPVELAFLSHVLHFSSDPKKIVAKAFQLLNPEGRLIVLELDLHHEQWVLERLGHVRTGFDAQTLRELLCRAGFTKIEVERMPSRAAPPPFRILLATGIRNA